VIDEVIGMGIAALLCSFSFFEFALAFFLFRLFDITKPPPVRQLDEWSKKKAMESGPLWAGFGIMADDIVAGLQALATFWILKQLGWTLG
jgi:phosphatidylglycerophosphatase A